MADEEYPIGESPMELAIKEWQKRDGGFQGFDPEGNPRFNVNDPKGTVQVKIEETIEPAIATETVYVDNVEFSDGYISPTITTNEPPPSETISVPSFTVGTPSPDEGITFPEAFKYTNSPQMLLTLDEYSSLMADRAKLLTLQRQLLDIKNLFESLDS